MRTDMASRKSTPLVRVLLGASFVARWVGVEVMAAKPDNPTPSAYTIRAIPLGSLAGW